MRPAKEGGALAFSNMMKTTLTPVLVFPAFYLILFNNVLVKSKCPDDVDGETKDNEKGCPEDDIPVIMFSFAPYAIISEDTEKGLLADGIVYEYIANSLEDCCSGKLYLDLVNNFTNTDIESESFEDDLSEADVIFPVTNKVERELTFSGNDYTFHDIVKSPGYVLLGRIDHYNKKARRLVLQSLYDSWPIFAMIFLLAGIAGIFIWALEYHIKNEEFPLSFTRGSYEGFWWAFISMTTVGYGDKTPRSFIGRLFGVLWILLGLIVITMFTAIVTAALTNLSSPEFTNSMEGMDVGVLSRNSEAADDEANYMGANPIKYKNHDDLEEALLKEEIGGIFMERLQANYYYKDKTNDDNLRVFQSVHSEITYKMALRVKAMCSLLEKNSCFKRRLENPLIDSLVKNYTKPLKVFQPSMDTEGLLSGSSKHTGKLLLAILGVFLGLFILGVLIELFVTKSGICPRKPASDEIRVVDVGFQHVNVTLKQVDNLEKDLQTLSSQVKAMKENLENTNWQRPIRQNENSFMLTDEIRASNS